MALGNGTGQLGLGIEPVAQRGQRIDDGVARHGDAALQVLAQQVGARRGRGRKHPLADHIDHAAVHLFGKGLGQIPGAQAGFHVAHRNAAVKRRQRAGRGRAGVAVHQHVVGLFLLQHAIGTCHHAGEQAVERLVGLHDGEIVLRLQAEQIHHLVQHLPVLAGDAHHALDAPRLRQGRDQWRHLDGLGTGPEKRKNLHANPFCVFLCSSLVRSCAALYPAGAGPVSARRRAGQAAKRCGIYGGFLEFSIDCSDSIENYRQLREIDGS